MTSGHPAIAASTCPRCGLRGPVALAPDQICERCCCDDAWEAHRTRGPLVVSRDEIAAATAWRDDRRRRLPWRHIGLAAASAGVAATAAALTAVLFRAQPPCALAALMARVDAISWRAIGAGAAALFLGLAGVVLLRRSARLRSHTLVLGHLAGVVVGAVAVLIGGLHLSGFRLAPGFAYDGMPPLASIPPAVVAPHFARVARATAVIIAPDEDGDARFGAIGAGAVIATRSGRAWIVTCSHVAIPYQSPASVRRPERARPVWVQLADGRGAPGRVVWTAPPPLDVALVAIAVARPPEPVEVAPPGAALAPGSPVLFVPNPYRDGWRMQRGAVERREPHATPAGEVSLVYTSLPVLPGDSGTGLYDGSGRLVGLNTWNHYDKSGPHGISLPSEVLQSVTARLGRGALEPGGGKEEP